MSTQASTAVKQMLGQAMKMAGGQLSNQALTMISTQTDMLPVTTAQALLTPFEVQEEVVHPVGINHARWAMRRACWYRFYGLDV